VPDLAALALGQDRDGGALLGGPLLTVDATGQLAGSPSSAVAPRPFDDALFAAMGKPSEDTDASLVPLLLSDRNLTLGGLRGALAPILGRNQWSFRWLVGDQRAAAGDLGPYADLIDSKPTRLTLDVDLIEHIEVLPAPAEARKAVGRAVLALRADPGREGFFSKIEATGGAGHYTLRPGARAAPLDARSFTRESPDPERVAVEELVLVAPADATVASLSQQLVQLAAYPLAQLSRHSLVPRRVRIVLTADDALFSR